MSPTHRQQNRGMSEGVFLNLSRNRVALLRVALSLMVLPFGAAQALDWQYGFVNANVTCMQGNRTIRIKYVSEVFGLCPYERNDITQVIVEDSHRALDASIRATCGPNYKIGFVFVEWTRPRERAVTAQKRALMDSAFSQHHQFHAGEERYYTKCQ
jgi:hypothetical protein